MAETDVNATFEEINIDPQLLWLRRPDGGGAIFAGTPGRPETVVTGNMMPYIDLSIGEIPLYRFPNEHIISFQHNINIGGVTASLSLIDPTNFFLERIFRFAYGYKKYPHYIKIRYGWTNGVDRWGTPDNNWLLFKISGLSQTINLEGTRWTITLMAYAKSILESVKVKGNINLKEATPDNLQAWIDGALLETGQNNHTVRVKMFGKFQQISNIESGGRYETQGDQSIDTVLRKILSMWQTTSGQSPEMEVDPYTIDYSETNLNKPYSTLFIYDRKYLAQARSQHAQQMNGSAMSKSPYRDCHAMINWPNTDGGITQIQMVSDLKYLVYSKIFSSAYTQDGTLSEQSRNILPPLSSSPAAGEQEHPNAILITEPGTATASSSEISSEQRATMEQQSDLLKKWTNPIEISTMGESWFQNPKTFRYIKFGIKVDELFNLEHFVPDFDGRDAEDLARAWPVLADNSGNLAREAADSGIFSKDSRAWINQIYELHNVEHTIQGSSFTSRFKLMPDINVEE